MVPGTQEGNGEKKQTMNYVWTLWTIHHSGALAQKTTKNQNSLVVSSPWILEPVSLRKGKKFWPHWRFHLKLWVFTIQNCPGGLWKDTNGRLNSMPLKQGKDSVTWSDYRFWIGSLAAGNSSTWKWTVMTPIKMWTVAAEWAFFNCQFVMARPCNMACAVVQICLNVHAVVPTWCPHCPTWCWKLDDIR